MTYKIDNDPVLANLFDQEGSVNYNKSYSSKFLSQLSKLIIKSEYEDIHPDSVARIIFEDGAITNIYDFKQLSNRLKNKDEMLKQENPNGYFDTYSHKGYFSKTSLKTKKTKHDLDYVYTLYVPINDKNIKPLDYINNNVYVDNSKQEYHLKYIESILNYLNENNFDYKFEFTNLNKLGYKIDLYLDQTNAYYNNKTDGNEDKIKTLDEVIENISKLVNIDINYSKHIFLPSKKGISISKLKSNGAIFNYVSEFSNLMSDFVNDSNYKPLLNKLNQKYLKTIKSDDLKKLEVQFKSYLDDFIDKKIQYYTNKIKTEKQNLTPEKLDLVNNLLNTFENIVSNNVDKSYLNNKHNLNNYLISFFNDVRSDKDIAMTNDLFNKILNYMNNYTDTKNFKFNSISDVSEYRGNLNIRTPMYKYHSDLLKSYLKLSEDVIKIEETIEYDSLNLSNLLTLKENIDYTLSNNYSLAIEKVNNKINPHEFESNGKTKVLDPIDFTNCLLETIDPLDPSHSVNISNTFDESVLNSNKIVPVNTVDVDVDELFLYLDPESKKAYIESLTELNGSKSNKKFKLTTMDDSKPPLKIIVESKQKSKSPLNSRNNTSINSTKNKANSTKNLALTN